MTTLDLRTSIGRSPLRVGFLLIPLTLVCLPLSPRAQAVVPPPDGGYSGANTAEGQNALLTLSTGHHNTAVGFISLGSDATGSYNTAIGAGALLANTSDENTATGFAALSSNSTGAQNTAIGDRALQNNTIGISNTGSGAYALYSNTTGSNNMGGGAYALFLNTTGRYNTANGNDALYSNTSGGANVAIGAGALSDADANFNTVVGFEAGQNLTLRTSSENIYIGDSAGTFDAGDESGTIRIGSGFAGNTACFIHGIFGNLTPGTAVFINATGQLSTTFSARRFKKDIDAMDKTSEAIYSLKPVTFHYKSDKTNMPYFGLIAEEVAAVNPDLVLRDEKGEMYSVRYEQINAMLLNEFLKEHRTVQELKSNAAKQEATIAQQQKQIEALTAGLQKVSAQLEVSKPAPQVVNNP